MALDYPLYGSQMHYDDMLFLLSTVSTVSVERGVENSRGAIKSYGVKGVFRFLPKNKAYPTWSYIREGNDLNI